MRGDIGGKIFGGLLLIAVGVVFLLNQLGMWDVDIGYVFSHYWPVILIVFGLKGILIQRRLEYGWGGSYLWNLVVVVVGLVFLNNNMGWFDQIGFHDIFKVLVPIILITLGLNMMFRPKKQKPTGKGPEWANPMEPPFKPYSSYESPLDPPAAPVPPSADQGVPPVSGPDPKKPFDPFPQHDPNDPNEAWKNDLPQNPPIVKDWIVWKEQMKKDWRHHKKELRQEWRDRRRAHGHHDSHGRFDSEGDFKGHGHEEVQHRHNFIGDLHVGQDYWELRNMNISHFIGDTELDLTRAVIPYGETKINISAFIGDVKVYVPNDVQLEVSVTASSFLGDINVFERHEGGMFRSMQSASTGFKDAEKRVRIVVSMFIGDVKVKRVG